MRYPAFLTLLGLFTVASSVQAQTTGARPNGLIARWLGNGDARDISGNGHDGTVTPEVRYQTGIRGKGFLFNGTGGGVTIPDSPAFRLSDALTITAWVKVDSVRDGKIVFRGDNRSGLDPWSLALNDGENGHARIQFVLTGYPQGTPGAQEQDARLSAPVPLGQFVHLVGTLDTNKGVQRLYVDGKLAAEQKTGVKPLASLDASQMPGLGIGNTQAPSIYNECFDGMIQDVQVYNRALNDDEVADLYSSTKPTPVATPAKAAVEPYRYWDRYPRPKALQVVPAPGNIAEGALLQTLSGLVARAEKAGKIDRLIWIDNGHPAYKEWLQRMQKQTGATIEGKFDTWSLVDKYAKAGIVRGYILYHPDEASRPIRAGYDGMDTSLNVATSLCASINAVAVADKDEATATKYGLKRLLDARAMTEQECFEKNQNTFSRKQLVLLDPKVVEMRAEAVAENALVISRHGNLYERALPTMDTDFPVIGWGTGDQWQVTWPALKQAGFQTQSDAAINLPALSTERIGATMQVKRPASATVWDVPWENDVHYATFLMGGDSLDGEMDQSLFGDLKNEWNSPARGDVALGWGCDFSQLAQVSPYTAQYMFSTATPQDDFVFSAGDYFFPDVFASDRPDSAALMAKHIARLGDYARLGGFHLAAIHFKDNTSTQAAVDACAAYVNSMPGLYGLFTTVYMWGASDGRVYWIPDGAGNETPAVATRFNIDVGGHRDPHYVAEGLNNMPHSGAPADPGYFSAVVVNKGAWFNPPSGGDQTAAPDQMGKGSTQSGVIPVKWCVSQLRSYVHVVTPTKFIQLMRLRLHPQPTLQLELNRLADRWHSLSAKGIPASKLDSVRERIHTALDALNAGDYRAAWETGGEANAALRRLESAPAGK